MSPTRDYELNKLKRSTHFAFICNFKPPHSYSRSFMKTATVKTETMVALASLALQSAKKLFQKSNLENKRDTYFDWSWRLRTKRWYWFLHVLGALPIFSRTFSQTMKFNHSVLGSDGGSLWRLLCLLVHPKTQHLKSLFGADIMESRFNI